MAYDLAMKLTKGNHVFLVCTHTDKKHMKQKQHIVNTLFEQGNN